MDAIDISADRYLRSSDDSDNFLNKIIGVCNNISLPLLDQKINFVSGYIAKDFGQEFWKVKQLINQYSNCLKEHWDYSDEKVIEDIEIEVNKLAKNSNQYYHFIQSLNTWMSDISRKCY